MPKPKPKMTPAILLAMTLSFSSTASFAATSEPITKVAGASVAKSEGSSFATIGITPQLGMVWSGYDEGPDTRFDALGFKAGFSAWSALAPDAILQLNASVTGIPVHRGGADIPVRFTSIEGFYIQELSESEAPHRIQLGGGGFFRRMFVKGNAFGYSDVSGPAVLGALEKRFPSGGIGRMKLAIAPVFDGILPMSPSNRGLTLGFEWKKALRGAENIGFSAEWNELRVKINQVKIESSSLSLGVSYGI